MPIVFDHVTYDYNPGEKTRKDTGWPQALSDICLEIPDGEFLGVIGHTGSGKSTLVQHMNGLLQPTHGRVLVDGMDLADKASRRAVRKTLGLAFQYPEMQLFASTVAEDIAFGPKNLGLSDDEADLRVREAMERLQLSYDELAGKSPFELSGGQQRLVALAGILAMAPSKLVLDEPTAGLDPAGREDLLGFVHQLHADGMTIVMVSHSMADVAEHADRVLVLNHGSIFMEGTPAEVFSHSGELSGIGLGVPRAAKFGDELRERGFDVPRGIYTIEALADALAQAIGPRTKDEYLAMVAKSGGVAAASSDGAAAAKPAEEGGGRG